MTPSQWKSLPPWVRRADVVAVGIPEDVLAAKRFEMPAPDAAVPPGCIGAVRGLTARKDGAATAGPGYFKYAKWTVTLLLPREYR
jgi:hypothetical protein